MILPYEDRFAKHLIESLDSLMLSYPSIAHQHSLYSYLKWFKDELVENRKNMDSLYSSCETYRLLYEANERQLAYFKNHDSIGQDYNFTDLLANQELVKKLENELREVIPPQFYTQSFETMHYFFKKCNVLGKCVREDYNDSSPRFDWSYNDVTLKFFGAKKLNLFGMIIEWFWTKRWSAFSSPFYLVSIPISKKNCGDEKLINDLQELIYCFKKIF